MVLIIRDSFYSQIHFDSLHIQLKTSNASDFQSRTISAHFFYSFKNITLKDIFISYLHKAIYL